MASTKISTEQSEQKSTTIKAVSSDKAVMPKTRSARPKLLTKQEILEKKYQLEEVSKQLKQEFIGLDHIIDETLSLLSPWFLFPEAQMRPTIVNLWGMTGTGKSAMVKKLVELLDFTNRFVYLDMGEQNSESGSGLKHTFAYSLSFYNEKEVIICMDEFQFARTINENGEEITRENLRIIWELLDSGKFYHALSINNYYVKRAMRCYMLLEKSREKEVVIRNGEVVKNLKVFQDIFKDFYFSFEPDDDSDKKKLKAKDYFSSEDFAYGIERLADDLFESRQELVLQLKQFDLDGVQQFLAYCIDQETSMQELDFSRSLIFNIGNLDEAFYMSNNMNPDISADDFYQEAQKVTISHVKTALQKRFRNEQIARMGNNHLIYPAFNQKNYYLFIDKELKRIGDYVNERFHLQIHFEKSMRELLYQEGVFPTQGARPVLTTIKNQVESHISTMICHWLEKELPAQKINWSYQNEKYTIQYFDKDDNQLDSIEISLRLKVNSLRKSKNNDAQAFTAVHEAGHAVTAALSLRILPTTVVTQTASSDASGFCQINFPEDVRTFEILKKDIMISVSGYIAEKMIFGTNQLSTGSTQDIQHATIQANAAVREFGMLQTPMRITVESSENNLNFFYEKEHGEMAQNLLQECTQEAEELLKRNKRFLLELASYLTLNSRINAEKIKVFAEKYAEEEWVRKEGFVEKDQYFQFKSTLEEQLKQLQKNDPASIKKAS